MDLLNQHEDYNKRDFTIFCFSAQMVKKGKDVPVSGLFRLDIKPDSNVLECWEICISQLDDKTGHPKDHQMWVFDSFLMNANGKTATLGKQGGPQNNALTAMAQLAFNKKGFVESVSIFPDLLIPDKLLYTNCALLNPELLCDKDNTPDLCNLTQKDIFDLQHFCLHFTSYGVEFKTRVAFQWLAELLKVYASKTIKTEEPDWKKNSREGKKGVTAFLLREIQLLKTKSVLSLYKINRQLKQISLKEEKDTELTLLALKQEYIKNRSIFINFTVIMFILDQLVLLEKE